MLLAYRVAAGSAPLVELGIGALFLGGDPCVADQTACDGGSPAVCAHSALVAFRIGPECISICPKDFTRPHWCGNHTFPPEKCGIGPENLDLMWRSAWVRSGTNSTDVPEAAAWRSRRGGRHGDICLTRRARRDWPHPSPCRIQSLPDELLAEWITALGAVQFSRAKRPFSGATAVGMARLGGFDPEIPVQNGPRHLAPCSWPSAAFLQIQHSACKRPFAEVADGPAPLRAAADTAEGQGCWP